MLGAILFWMMLLSAGVLVAINGTPAARRFLILVLIATLATAATDLFAAGAVAPYIYFAIDLALLVAALAYALTLPVYWPLWFAGFQCITVGSHLGRLTMPDSFPAIYANLAGFWAVPALLTMAIGTMKDRRAGWAADDRRLPARAG